MSHWHVRARPPWLASGAVIVAALLCVQTPQAAVNPLLQQAARHRLAGQGQEGWRDCGAWGEKAVGVRSCVLVYFRLEADVIHFRLVSASETSREPGPFRTVVSARFRRSAEEGLLNVKSLRWIGEPEIRWADDGRTWIYDRYAVRM